jgi:cation diffusion facilitator CzcD-associated flavoprotein CzcO
MNTVIVGGGPAGIATGAGLRRRGLDSVVLEAGDTVAAAWQRHYERLHLHTNKEISGLPGQPMPASYPRYPSRDQVFEYMQDYASSQGVEVRLGTAASKVSREDGSWVVETAGGDVYGARNVVIATGLNRIPMVPKYPSQETYTGEILHSADYRNGDPYVGKHVLVIGFGNSAGEIALDLMEHGANPHISVRGPSVVVPRDIAGIPILSIARWLSIFPPRVADWLSKPVLAATVGNVEKIGVPAAPWGPFQQIAEHKKIPMLDIGTIAALKKGAIKAQPAIQRFTETGVIFTTGTSEPFDAVIFGTGWEAGIAQILPGVDGVLDADGRPLVSGGRTSEQGLYFCGFYEPPTGRLRQIGIEAERIAGLIAAS